MTKIYVCCKKDETNDDGEIPVLLLFQNGKDAVMALCQE